MQEFFAIIFVGIPKMQQNIYYKCNMSRIADNASRLIMF